MALKSDAIIDATNQGNISRFINHSCDPNAETQKWTVNGDLRVGFFVRKSCRAGEELTFDYQFQRYGKEAQRCYCESYNCRGWIGEDPEKEDKNKEKREKRDREKRRKSNLYRYGFLLDVSLTIKSENNNYSSSFALTSTGMKSIMLIWKERLIDLLHRESRIGRKRSPYPV